MLGTPGPGNVLLDLLAAVEDVGGQVLDEAHALGDLDLLLLGQLRGRPRHVRRRIVDRHVAGQRVLFG